MLIFGLDDFYVLCYALGKPFQRIVQHQGAMGYEFGFVTLRQLFSIFLQFVQVKQCRKSRPHDWTLCPAAHNGVSPFQHFQIAASQYFPLSK